MMYHYCCQHSLAAIAASSWLLRPQGPIPVVWMTDLASPDRSALGLTSHLLSCDRTDHRLTVAPDQPVEFWPEYCRRTGLTRQRRELLEGTPGARPAHWYVSDQPIRVVPQWVGAR